MFLRRRSVARKKQKKSNADRLWHHLWCVCVSVFPINKKQKTEMFKSPWLEQMSNLAVVSAAREVSGLFVQCEQGELGAAVKLGRLLETLKMSQPGYVTRLLRALVFINEQAAGSLYERLLEGRQARTQVLALVGDFDEVERGSFDAYRRFVEHARNLPDSVGEQMSIMLEFGIEAPDGLEFLIEASAWLKEKSNATSSLTNCRKLP